MLLEASTDYMAFDNVVQIPMHLRSLIKLFGRQNRWNLLQICLAFDTLGGRLCLWG